MGLRAGLDGCGKSRPPPGFDPRTVQPAASRYTDYVMPASIIIIIIIIINSASRYNHLNSLFSPQLQVSVLTS